MTGVQPSAQIDGPCTAFAGPLGRQREGSAGAWSGPQRYATL